MTDSPRLTKAEYERLAAFRFALRQFLHFSETAAHTARLAPQQHQALLAIKGFPGRDWVNVQELAERLHLRHHSVVELVNRLEAERLVRREPDPSDGRKVRLQLSARGERVLAKLSAAHRKELNRIGPQLARLLAELGNGKPE